MSSGVDVPQSSTFWSYFTSEPSAGTTRNRRTSSVSLPNFSTASAAGTARRPHKRSAPLYRVAWMNHGQRARLLKAAGLLSFIFLLYFYFAPASQPRVPYVQKCTKSSAPDKPLIQYALMVDAGSTGSRIHVYRFNNCGPTPELEDEIFEQTAKKEGGAGLSSYREDIQGAAKSLDPLMAVAMKHVPDDLKSCTPVAVKATAGLRDLGPELSEKILKAVRTRLETVYPFPVLSDAKGGVEVMPGKDEGVYAWITANYLLGKIGRPDLSPTAAVFDLGGGSTQIVFEPNYKTRGGGFPDKLSEGDHKYDLNFGGRNFTLYQHSYLGYGLMKARQNLHQAHIDAIHEANHSDESWLQNPVENPCIAPGMSRKVTVKHPSNPSSGKPIEVKMIGPADGAPAQCQALAEKTLRKEEECKLLPCAFNGVHQPSLEKTFATEDIYLFSYFYDRTKPLGMPESFTLKELKDLAYRVCNGKSAWGAFKNIDGAMKELEGRPETCLDLTYMLALLHKGYEMPLDRKVKIAKKIKGNELGWCLGASLPLLSQGSGWTCRIKELS